MCKSGAGLGPPFQVPVFTSCDNQRSGASNPPRWLEDLPSNSDSPAPTKLKSHRAATPTDKFAAPDLCLYLDLVGSQESQIH